MMLTPSHASLFPLFGSGVSLERYAQSLTSCASVAVSLTTIVVRPPAGSVPRLQVTTPRRGHAPPGLAFSPRIVNVPLLTWLSVMTTLRASDGPRLSTKILHVATSPGCIGWSGLHCFVILMSARSSTIVEALAVVVRGVRILHLVARHFDRVGDANGVAGTRHRVGLDADLDDDGRGRSVQDLSEVAGESARRSLGADPAIVRHELDLRRKRVLDHPVGHVVRAVVRDGDGVEELPARVDGIRAVRLRDSRSAVGNGTHALSAFDQYVSTMIPLSRRTGSVGTSPTPEQMSAASPSVRSGVMFVMSNFELSIQPIPILGSVAASMTSWLTSSESFLDRPSHSRAGSRRR